MTIVNSSQQIFPVAERVIYKNASLEEVICQFRFPVDLRIETSPPADFQQRIRRLFPILNQTSQSVLSSLPVEIAKAFDSVVPSTGSTTIWSFTTEDDKYKLDLSKDRLTLSTQDYTRWNNFFDLITVPVESLVEIYEPPFYSRLGLRYRNFIDRAKIGLKKTPWSELLQPHVLGELSEPGIEECATEAHRVLQIALPKYDAKVKMQHGFAEMGNDKISGYMIDSDFFTERTEIANGLDIINYFHENAFRYFRWCITENLHRALDPESLVVESRGN